MIYALDHPDEFGLDEHAEENAAARRAGPDYQLMGECFLAAGRPEDAQAAFEKAETVAPDKALRQFNLARVAAKTGKPAEALAALEAAFAEHLAGQGMAPYETLADVLDKLGKKDELIGRLEKLRAAEPDNRAAGLLSGRQYRAAGKLDKAEPLYLELLKTKPTLTGYRELADIYRQAKRFDALLAVMGEAVEKTGVLETLGAEAQTASPAMRN